MKSKSQQWQANRAAAKKPAPVKKSLEISRQILAEVVLAELSAGVAKGAPLASIEGNVLRIPGFAILGIVASEKYRTFEITLRDALAALGAPQREFASPRFVEAQVECGVATAEQWKDQQLIDQGWLTGGGR